MPCNDGTFLHLLSCVARGPVSYRTRGLRWQSHHDARIMAIHEFHHYHDFFSSPSHSLFHFSSFSTELMYLTLPDFLCCFFKIYILFKKSLNYVYCMSVCMFLSMQEPSQLLYFSFLRVICWGYWDHLWLKVNPLLDHLNFVHRTYQTPFNCL